MSKIVLVALAAGGYLLGSRAGRGHYEIVRDQALKLWRSPQVQEAAAQATEAAKDTDGRVQLATPQNPSSGGADGSAAAS